MDSFKFRSSAPWLSSHWAPIITTVVYLTLIHALKQAMRSRTTPFQLKWVRAGPRFVCIKGSKRSVAGLGDPQCSLVCCISRVADCFADGAPPNDCSILAL